MFDFILGLCKKDEIEKACEYKPFVPLPMPPMAFPRREPFIRDQIRKMLLACLTGGMSYDEAKVACELEFGEELASAKDADKKADEIYRELREEWSKAFDKAVQERRNG